MFVRSSWVCQVVVLMSLNAGAQAADWKALTTQLSERLPKGRYTGSNSQGECAVHARYSTKWQGSTIEIYGQGEEYRLFGLDQDSSHKKIEKNGVDLFKLSVRNDATGASLNFRTNRESVEIQSLDGNPVKVVVSEGKGKSSECEKLVREKE